MTSGPKLDRWHVGRHSVLDWLASAPDAGKMHAMLVRALDRPRRGGVFARVLADRLGLDVDQVYAQRYPRKAARLAKECRDRGDDPHADTLHAALVALMFCANCGRPLGDPESVHRGIGPDCWQVIDPAWRQAIELRTAWPDGDDGSHPGGRVR